MLLAISSPADNERGPIYAEQMLAALHQANRRRLPVSLIFSRHDQTVGLYCRVPEQLESTLRQQLIARYHDCDLTELPGDALNPPVDRVTVSLDLRLRPDLRQIHARLEFDPRTLRRNVAHRTPDGGRARTPKNNGVAHVNPVRFPLVDNHFRARNRLNRGVQISNFGFRRIGNEKKENEKTQTKARFRHVWGCRER